MRSALPMLLSLALLTGCTAGEAELVVAGTVDASTELVSMPNLVVPEVNLAAGSGQQGRVSATTAATYGLGSFPGLVEVLVREGDSVRAGQVLARVDAAGLGAAVAAARTDADVTASSVGQLSAAIQKTYDKAAEIADKKADVKKAINTLTKTKKKLEKARAEVKKQRPKLVAKLRQLQQLLANYPPVPVPGIPSQQELQAGIAKLKAGLKKLDAGLKKINAALPKLRTGLRKARDGLAKLDDAAEKVAEARAQLIDLRELAELAADAMGVPIEVAEAQLQLTELVAPADGVVVRAAVAGDRLAPGATVVGLRPSAPSRVSAWLSPSQLNRVCLGDNATISGDWGGEPVAATLTSLGTQAEYPPTWVPTDEVHLTRAVAVEFTAAAQLPAGVPVQLQLPGCHPAAANTSEDR